MKIIAVFTLLLSITGCQKMSAVLLGSEYDTQAVIADDIDSHLVSYRP